MIRQQAITWTSVDQEFCCDAESPGRHKLKGCFTWSEAMTQLLQSDF